MTGCKGCGKELPPIEGRGRPRVWCSEDCRRASYKGRCRECGAITNGGSGPAYVPVLCRSCEHEQKHREAKARIIAALQEWHRRYGEVPAAVDWNLGPSQQGRLHPERQAQTRQRHQGVKWPNLTSVLGVFGTWNAAIRAAGFEPIRRGARRDPDTWRRHRFDREAA